MSKFTPKTRLEKFLAKIAGRSEEELKPKTRLEAVLDDIAENIGQGGGSTGGGGNVTVFEGNNKGVEFNGEHFDELNITANGEKYKLSIFDWYDEVPNGAVLCVNGDTTDEQGRKTGVAQLKIQSANPADPDGCGEDELVLLSEANIIFVASNVLDIPIYLIPRNATYAKGNGIK